MSWKKLRDKINFPLFLCNEAQTTTIGPAFGSGLKYFSKLLYRQPHLKGTSIPATRHYGVSLVPTQSDVTRVSDATSADCSFFCFVLFFAFIIITR